MSQEEEKAREREKQKLVKGLDVILSFTAEEEEEIRRAIKTDPKLRGKIDLALAKLREIEALGAKEVKE